ncbi:MAG TPA: hypothetical protein VJK51_00020 [Candidatus Nanoarchaeia archaeon]|nr:hypothetical protein [Candidatus Nanoarchaeia archaeon]
MAIHATLKRWGNSMAIIVPNEMVEAKNLKEQDTILIEIVKEANIHHLFGTLKQRKHTGQEFKNLARKGWQS